MVVKGRILALDYGTRRIGVAMSDPTCVFAQGLPTISYRKVQGAISDIMRSVQTYSIQKIIVGMPLNLKGQKTQTTEAVENFIVKIEKRLNIPIEPWDERLTTVAAHRAMIEMGKSPSRNKEKVDELAAVLLLQNYLDTL